MMSARTLALWIAPLFWFVFFRLVTSKCEARSGSPRWWSLAVSPGRIRTMSCSQVPGLNSRQLRFCMMNRAYMASIVNGTEQGFKQCQFQFKNKRWNCSTTANERRGRNRRSSIFGNVLERGSREAAFVHALAAAGVAHSITKSCYKGQLLGCRCNRNARLRSTFPEQPPPPRSPRSSTSSSDDVGEDFWRWGSCDENIEFGIAKSREFVDARDHSKSARSIMNRHNNEAGRVALREKRRLKCKCHGVSGSCELKTCWLVLPDFNSVGHYLRQRYTDASHMKVRSYKGARGCEDYLTQRYPFHGPYTKRDLIYYENSPDFCDENQQLGIKGTRGRVCNAHSEGIDGCFLLCCGRGYVTVRKTRTEKCNCVFNWCCTVECDDCVIEYEEHTCK